VRKFTYALAIAFVVSVLASQGQAQGLSQNPYGGGYTITTPGQPSTFVNPNPGGYTAITPGQSPTFINRNPYGGGYTVITPGQPTTFVNPNPYGR
jgi:hypothetical protein